jgi:hypothetical protein
MAIAHDVGGTRVQYHGEGLQDFLATVDGTQPINHTYQVQIDVVTLIRWADENGESDPREVYCAQGML